MLEKQINLKVAIGIRLNFKLFGDGSIPFGIKVLFFVCGQSDHQGGKEVKSLNRNGNGMWTSKEFVFE